MGECIDSVVIKVIIQENGIIRVAKTGSYIARLDDESRLKYEDLKQFEGK